LKINYVRKNCKISLKIEETFCSAPIALVRNYWPSFKNWKKLTGEEDEGRFAFWPPIVTERASRAFDRHDPHTNQGKREEWILHVD
jgi:hypothetical protein